MDGGATDSSCPSHRVHHSSSELKLHISFQFEGPRYSSSTGHDEASHHPSSSTIKSGRYCARRLGWKTCSRHRQIARDYFSIQIHRVYDTLVWMTQNNEDYKEITIDHTNFERCPPVWVAEDLLDLAGAMEDSGREDNAQIGIATEDSGNAEMAPGDVPMTASGIIDTAAVSEPAQLQPPCYSTNLIVKIQSND